jgi:hypothetical protein
MWPPSPDASAAIDAISSLVLFSFASIVSHALRSRRTRVHPSSRTYTNRIVVSAPENEAIHSIISSFVW